MYEKKPIHIVYHVALMGCWKEIFESQLNLLCDSKISEAAEKIHISVVGSKKTFPNIHQIIDKYALKSKVKISYNGPLEKYEFPGIRTVQEIALKNPNSRILYFHTKGASHCIQGHSQITLNRLKQWRKFLEYATIENWKSCYIALETYDSCGPDLAIEGHYWGNFWWATAQYISSIKFETSQQINRGLCETFIGLNNPKTYEVINSINNTYIKRFFNDSELIQMKMPYDNTNVFRFGGYDYYEAFYRPENIYFKKYKTILNKSR